MRKSVKVQMKIWLSGLLCFLLALVYPNISFAELTDAPQLADSEGNIRTAGESRLCKEVQTSKPGLTDSPQPGSGNQSGTPTTEANSKEQLAVENSKSMETKDPEVQKLTYGNLREGELVEGFRTDAVYVNESDKEIGARFRHIKSGMFVDLVQIESVPQCFIWVNTVPTSDNGAPHTQEHLLLGKGNKGRELGTRNELSLVSSSAMTMPWRTAITLTPPPVQRFSSRLCAPGWMLFSILTIQILRLQEKFAILV